MILIIDGLHELSLKWISKTFFLELRSSWKCEGPPEPKGQRQESEALHSPLSFIKEAPYTPAYALKLHEKFALKERLKRFL